MYLCICICVFVIVFLYLYLYICICLFVFVYLYVSLIRSRCRLRRCYFRNMAGQKTFLVSDSSNFPVLLYIKTSSHIGNWKKKKLDQSFGLKRNMSRQKLLFTFRIWCFNFLAVWCNFSLGFCFSSFWPPPNITTTIVLILTINLSPSSPLSLTSPLIFHQYHHCPQPHH